MKENDNKTLLYETMKEAMAEDRAKHNILPLSKFGLMQITRQRVRPVVEVDVTEECPACHGKGRVQPSILFTDTLDEQIELYKTHFGSGLRLYVHPFVYAYASQGFFLTNLKAQWRRRYGVHLYADESIPLLAYRFVGKDGKQVELPRMLADSLEKKADKKSAKKSKKADKDTDEEE